jgi:hypothetical protein
MEDKQGPSQKKDGGQTGRSTLATTILIMYYSIYNVKSCFHIIAMNGFDIERPKKLLDICPTVKVNSCWTKKTYFFNRSLDFFRGVFLDGMTKLLFSRNVNDVILTSIRHLFIHFI